MGEITGAQWDSLEKYIRDMIREIECDVDAFHRLNNIPDITDTVSDILDILNLELV